MAMTNYIVTQIPAGAGMTCFVVMEFAARHVKESFHRSGCPLPRRYFCLTWEVRHSDPPAGGEESVRLCWINNKVTESNN
jgi:hypothetical protein